MLKFRWLRKIAFLCGWLAVGCVRANGIESPDRIEVKVGGYYFPPYVEISEDGAATGVTPDLIAYFNQIQSKYHFSFFPTAPKRRYMDMMAGRYQIIMFENKSWGWKPYPVEASHVFMGGGERYVTLKKPARSEAFFDDFSQKRMVGLLGYHYGFAQFISSEEYLTSKYLIFLSNSHERNLELVMLDRPELAEVTVITDAYLQRIFKQHPEWKNTLLVSEKWDQRYQHTVLVHDVALGVSVEEVDNYLNELEKSGKLSELAKTYYLTR